MNKLILKSALAFVFLFGLSGCHRELNYDYLMQHPEVLQKHYEQCRGQTTAQCDEVVRAAEDFRLLIQKRSENPEAMGLEIIRAQEAGDQKKVKVLYAVIRVTSPE